MEENTEQLRGEIVSMVNTWLKAIYEAPEMSKAIVIYMSACETFLKYCEEKTQEDGK